VLVTYVFLLLALLLRFPPEPRPIEGSGKPVEREHTLTEADVDSLASAMQAFDLVFVAGLEGLPGAAREREAFLKGFRDAFREKTLPTERVRKKTGGVVAGEPLRNHMQLAVDEGSARWLVRIKLGWRVPAADSAWAARGGADSLARAWPGLGAQVRVGLEWNGDDEGRGPGPPAAALDFQLRLPPGHLVDAAYYQHAGRQVAFLVLEALHRPGGWLDDDERLRLEDTRRESAVPLR
jgi:hypothetical protein